METKVDMNEINELYDEWLAGPRKLEDLPSKIKKLFKDYDAAIISIDIDFDPKASGFALLKICAYNHCIKYIHGYNKKKQLELFNGLEEAVEAFEKISGKRLDNFDQIADKLAKGIRDASNKLR